MTLCSTSGVLPGQIFDMTRPLELPLQNSTAAKEVLEAEKGAGIGRNAWKHKEWSESERIGFEGMSRASDEYYRVRGSLLPKARRPSVPHSSSAAHAAHGVQSECTAGRSGASRRRLRGNAPTQRLSTRPAERGT